MQPAQPIPDPGYTTTEFWLTLLTIILSNILPYFANNQIGQLIGIAVSVLAAYGYTSSRTTVKTTAINNTRTLNVVKQPPDYGGNV